jgi:hypothetical protein
MTQKLSRRDFLQATSAGLAAGLLPAALIGQDRASPDRGAQKGQKPKPPVKRVVLIAFAGGCRSKEVLGAPANVPNLTRIAAQGCVLPNVHAENIGHYGATLSLFTGNYEAMGIRENERGINPTVFEYLRKDLGFAPHDCWLSTAGGAQARLFAHSSHRDYGSAFGANLIDGDGVFNAEFKALVEKFGKPRLDSDKDEAVMAKLSSVLDSGTRPGAGSMGNDAATVRRIEKFIVEEITGSTTQITGPGAGDAKTIRIGANIFRTFKPKVMGITLQGHDVAHNSFNGYVEVIRRNDAEIGRLWDGIQQDEELRQTTTVIVMPEFGRDRNLNQRQGLDHGDSSEELRKVFLIAAGPAIKKGKVVLDACRTIDAAPTLLSFFGAKQMSGGAKVIRGILA